MAGAVAEARPAFPTPGEGPGPRSASQDEWVRHTIRVATGLGILVVGCALAACATTPATPDDLEDSAGPTASSTPTTSTSLPDVTMPTGAATSTEPGIVVPDVIGLAPGQARLVLHSLGFVLVPFNTPCRKGTPASVSVLSSLSVPGPGQDARVGATALAPGSLRPARSRLGVTWSGCYPNGTTVPDVTGLSFDKAVRRLHLAGLAWACFSVPPGQQPRSTTTTSTPAGAGAPPADSSTDTSTPKGSSTTTAHRGTSATHHDTATTSTVANQTPHTPTVVSQGTQPGTIVKAHTAVDFTMHHCPQ